MTILNKNISSIFLGILTGCLILYFKKTKQLYKGPDSNVVKNTIYFENDTKKYWKFEPYIVIKRN